MVTPPTEKWVVDYNSWGGGGLGGGGVCLGVVRKGSAVPKLAAVSCVGEMLAMCWKLSQLSRGGGGRLQLW